MEKVKVLSIFGTRPEAAKMIPVVLALRNPRIQSEVCVTAQHRELLDDVLSPFGIKPDYDLDLMRPGQSLAQLTARALTGLEDVIRQAQPDWVLVHGDTATTLAASMAAFYCRGPRVGHVEAGLRSYDKYRPFPEEINRKLTTALADLHFAPTELARDQLLAENVKPVVVTGNTAIDLLSFTVQEDYSFQSAHIGDVDFGKRIILMTAHRRENWGTPLENICRAARRLADDFPDTFIIYAVHPNPAVQDTARSILSGHKRIKLTEPLGIFDMHNLMNRSYLILTDSGGLQEEAPALNKPVVVARDVTERPEGLDTGALVLAGTEEEQVYAESAKLLQDEERYAQMANAKNPFGDGHAAGRIVEALLNFKLER